MRLVLIVSAVTALAGAAEAADRYGSASRTPLPAAPAPVTSPTTPAAASPHLLSWSGKTQPTAPAEVAQAQADGPPAPLPAPPPQGAWRRPAPGAVTGAPQPLAGQTARYAQTAPAAPNTALPTSLYGSASPPTSQQMAQAAPPAAYAGGPRFYSVHREYGVAPDPIPQANLSGQATDLAAAPPPVDHRTAKQQRAAADEANAGVGGATPGSQGGDWGASDDPGLAGGDASQALTAQTPAQTGLGAPDPTHADTGSGHP